MVSMPSPRSGDICDARASWLTDPKANRRYLTDWSQAENAEMTFSRACPGLRTT
jgi:hypothetical protein